MSTLANQDSARPVRRLVAQRFEGASDIPADALRAATGLMDGDMLSPDKVNSARQAILDLCARNFPGQAPSLKCRMHTTIDGNVTLTWIIAEPA